MAKGDRTYEAGGLAAAPSRLGITAIVPCYNEVECVGSAYTEIRSELRRYDDVEILFIDDGSTDGTLAIIKEIAETDPCVKWISFTRNFGLEAAFTAGFLYATKPWTVQLDADVQFPPAAMHSLVATAMGGYDVVFGVRSDRKDPWHRRAGTIGYQFLARAWLGIELPRGASVFRVIRTSVAKKIARTRLSTSFFLATAPLLGARYTTVPSPHRPRQAGTAKWGLRQLAGHAMDLFVGFSLRPITAACLLALLGFGFGVLALGLLAAGVIGIPAIATVTLVESMVILLALAVIARYLVRVIRAQGGPPRFLIRESNFPVEPVDSIYEDEFYADARARIA